MMFKINERNIPALTTYLQDRGWLKEAEEIEEVSKPGEGNMNLVLRVRTGARTFILKQSRPYVEKYPQVPAPEKRALVEGAFYQKTKSDPVISQFMPALLGIDPASNILLLEDLGHTLDYSYLYRSGAQLSPEEVQRLVTYLNRLHQVFYKEATDDELLNADMRVLNHEHIFQYPFADENGMNLDSVLAGLQETARPYQTDAALKNKVNQLGERYLALGNALLHGDFYPGSWVKSAKGLKIIDPEFCFYGPVEFDLGVLIAHLKMARQADSLIESVLRAYHPKEPLNYPLLNQFVGVEMMRRLIGLAQLPLELDLPARKILLEEAYQLMMTN